MRLNITESGSDSSLHADVSLRALPVNDKAADKSKNHKVHTERSEVSLQDGCLDSSFHSE